MKKNHYLRTILQCLVLSFWCTVTAPCFAQHAISVMDYGADGTGAVDDSAAIQNAINAANAAGKSVFLPGGTYLINTRINLSGVILTGEGSEMGEGKERSILWAGTPGMTMLTCGAKSQVRNIGLQGANLANIGIKTTSARVVLTNVEVQRCRKTSYLLTATQNSTFRNCHSAYSVSAFTLANGARNNNFFHCSSDTSSELYHESEIGTPWSQTRAIYSVIDTADPDYGTQVTQNGNDRNNWFGGAHQNAAVGLWFENLSGYSSGEGANNQFYGVEFSCDRILDTQNSASLGVLLMNSCSFIVSDEDSPFGAGTKGFVNFQGNCNFTGGSEVPNRGITQNSNYSSLFVIDSDTFISGETYNSGDAWFDESSKSIVISGGTDSDGVLFSPIPKGDLVNPASTATVGKPFGITANLTFTITEINGSNPVKIMLALNQSPWLRTVYLANATGTYSVPVRIGEHEHDTFNVVISANGNDSCTIKGVTLKSYGYQ